MRKDNRNTFYGFTVAEILISLAIVMVVATTMVPIMGTQKVKRPNNHMNHGVAVCYYDSQGRLNYEYRENKAGGVSRAGLLENTDHCVFSVPKANYIEVIAVGAGGSSTNDDLQLRIVAGAHSGAGSLRIDNHFQEDIDHSAEVVSYTDANGVQRNDTTMPEKIRTTMNEWSEARPNEVFARYTDIQSPIGAGGTGKCITRWASGADCGATNPAGSFFPPEVYTPVSFGYMTNCWWYQHGRGGRSGRGLALDPVTLPLSGSSTITLEDNTSKTGVTIRDDFNRVTNSFALTASGNGNDANCNGESCTNGTDNNQNSVCTSRGSRNWCAGTHPSNPERNEGMQSGTEVILTKQCLDNRMSITKGTMTYTGQNTNTNAWNGGAYNWVYQDSSVDVTMARMGDYGNESDQIYENLRGELHLFPARSNNGDGSTFSVVTRADGSELLRSQSGADRATMELHRVPLSRARNDARRNILGRYRALAVQMPIEILELGFPMNDEHFRYIEKLTNAGFNIPLLQCKNRGDCPGYAGTGTYLVLGNTNRIEFLRIINRQEGGTEFIKYFDDDVDYQQETPDCLRRDRLERVDGLDWAYVCHGDVKNGGRGAVVVLW